MMTTKYAVLVGCNYVCTSLQLNGSGNNVKNMRTFLIEHMGYSPENIEILCDDYPKPNGENVSCILPTTYNITNSLLQLMTKSAKASEICFYYSGHGSRVVDNTIFQDVSSGYDSCLTPIDSNVNGVIPNNALYPIMFLSQCPTLILCDCCYSGSLFDLPYQYQVLYDGMSSHIVQQYKTSRIEINSNIVALGACSYTEVGYDFFDNDDKQFEGILTDSFLDAMKEYNYEATIQQILIRISEKYKLLELPSLPHPTLSSSRENPEWVFSHNRDRTVLSPFHNY